MTCPFYRCDGRPECTLGDDRAERHCGPLTYPTGPCTLDAIGRGDAWRAFAGQLYDLEGVGIFLRLPPHTDRKLICRYEMERFL